MGLGRKSSLCKIPARLILSPPSSPTQYYCATLYHLSSLSITLTHAASTSETAVYSLIPSPLADSSWQSLSRGLLQRQALSGFHTSPTARQSSWPDRPRGSFAVGHVSFHVERGARR